MAPANTPGRKKRENQYFDVGVQGRRTGITLKDTGLRDEHGLEPTEGIFSSPEKATTARRTLRKSNGTLTSSEDMDEAKSSAPEPTEVLTDRRLARDGKGNLPLPVGRSPIKTNLGATPRRGSSVGAKGSAFHSQTPHRASSHPAVNRVLDFSITEVRSSVEKSPKRNNALLNGVASNRRGGSDRRDAVDEAVEDVEDTSEVQVNGTFDHSPLPQLGDDTAGDETFPESELLLQGDDSGADLQHVDESSAAAQPKRGRGRPKRKSDLSSVAETQEPSLVQETSLQEDPKLSPVAAKRRGRPPRISNGDQIVESDERPTKRLRSERDTAPEEEADRKKGKKKGPKQKDANAKIVTGRKAGRPAKDASRTNHFAKPGMRVGSVKLREETPMEDDGASKTRSGRVSFKPLEYWKGERAVFNVQPGPSYGSIEQIIRADDVTPLKRTHALPSRPRRNPRRTFSVFEEEQDDDEEEPWELDEGTVSGPVRMWDSELGAAPAEDEREQQLAFASGKIEPRPTLDNPNFCFTKTLTMPFFGAGVIELPPGGYKGTKNSRRFQFLFFVHYGKVAVEVAENRFVITKGGMWQVPRGNFYSITNETDHPAKIIFSQGCEVEAEQAEAQVSMATNGE